VSAGPAIDAAAGSAEPAATIIAFLVRIGLPVRLAPVAGEAFLPGIRIAAGALEVDPDRLRWPGDLLHEAGHIATTPAAARIRLDDALASAPAIAHAGEAEATAWAWAALLHTGLPPAILFHSGGYHGRSEGLLATYGLGVYPGAHGLAQAGMTLLGDRARAAGVPPYPHMLRWLRA
jgi:hypothetical protein